MPDITDRERTTQNRVIRLFEKRLGYDYLGNFEYRQNNSNVETSLLEAFLIRQGYPKPIRAKAIELFQKEIGNQVKTLYDINKAVYSLLRYGVPVKPDAHTHTESVFLIDWNRPEKNHFALAEEVTVAGNNPKRPDIVIYVNGIALAILELKRSTVSVSEGIRQNIGNQKEKFIKWFFATIQVVMAGNDTAGIRYATTETREKYYLKWKDTPAGEKPADLTLLDWELLSYFEKSRLLEIIHDFIIYDFGTKKICRPNQYFGVKAAQKRIGEGNGGIIWHTQGSGKSLTMVWLTKWLREHASNARVLVITDRTELDEQIEGIFKGVDENMYRTKNGKDLITKLNDTTPPILCSLIHKFKDNTKKTEDDDDETFIEEIKSALPRNFKPKGDFIVFVDECHRTQSGKMHDAMKNILPGAILIGFTGTPLLKSDKGTTIEKFGPFIHTYKYDEAVADEVVLDLRYEARDIEPYLKSKETLDKRFEAQTKGLSDRNKALLKEKWANLQKINSSKSRQEMIVDDILNDMVIRPRLMTGQGNALLVTGSIYQACTCYELFSHTELAGKCAIITSYKPSPGDISKEDSGEGLNEKLRQYEIYQKMLADYFNEPPKRAVSKAELFEKEVKRKFIEEPGQMKLLIVVDKLLTGFDAPCATYLYIDKNMQDHGLFQAICRVNRLDGDSKDYGYIVDYRDLFQSLEQSVKDYTAGAFEGYDKEDVQELLTNRITSAKDRLEKALEKVRLLCEKVPDPRDTLAYTRYFCGNDTNDPLSLRQTEEIRQTLYTAGESLIRAYANIATDMVEAGYSVTEAKEVQEEVRYYTDLMKAVKIASGEDIDLKLYEPAMRRLIDTFIEAKPARARESIPDKPLMELILTQGEEGIDSMPDNLKGNKTAVAEAIERNVRRIILEKSQVNPKYYEKLSDILDVLIKERNSQSEGYDKFLANHIKDLIELAQQADNPGQNDPDNLNRYPETMDTPAKKTLYDNLLNQEELVLNVYETAIRYREDGWATNELKTRKLRSALCTYLNEDQVDNTLEILKHQPELN